MAQTLTGDKALNSKLAVLKSSAVQRVMKPAMSKGLDPIMRRAKSNAPWASIRRLIGKKVTGRGTKISGKVFMKPSNNRTIMLDGREVGFEVVANILEFGSAKQNIRPQPFMRPAREQAKGAALKAMEREAWSKLDKIAAKGGSIYI